MKGKGGPLVSIVLPTHNRADVVAFAISSVQYQTLEDWELLVVGDGCTDETSSVVAGFDDARITWLDLPKAPGIGYANRNVALRQARGKYIAYIPHDDLWLVDHLQLLVDLAEERNAEFVYSRILNVDEQGRMTPTSYNLDAAVMRDDLRPRAMRLGIGSVLHTKECLERYGYWEDEGVQGGDHRLWMRFIEGGNRRRFAFFPAPTALHFVADWRRRPERPWLLRSKGEVLTALGVTDELTLPALRVPVPEGTSEQEAVWREISVDPIGWTRHVRTASQAYLDERADTKDDFALLAASAIADRTIRAGGRIRRRVLKELAEPPTPEEKRRTERTRFLEDQVKKLRD